MPTNTYFPCSSKNPRIEIFENHSSRYISIISVEFSYHLLGTGSCTDVPGAEYILDLDDCNEATNELYGKDVDDVNYSSGNWARGCSIWYGNPVFNTNLGGSNCRADANCICKVPRTGIHWNTIFRQNCH